MSRVMANREARGDDKDTFITVFSLRRKWFSVWSAFFTILLTLGIGVVTWVVLTSGGNRGFAETIVAIIKEANSVPELAAGVAYALLEIGRFSMVLAGYLEDRIKARDRARQETARAEGRVEGMVDILARVSPDAREDMIAQLPAETRRQVEEMLRDKNGDMG